MILRGDVLALVRWVVAFLIVASVHGALALVMVGDTEPPEPENTTGAFVIDLAPVPKTMVALVQDNSPEPASIDSTASEAVAPSTEHEKPPSELDMPPLPELATAPPDLVLPKMPETPPERTPIEAENIKQPAVAQDAGIAARAATPPVVDAAAPAERSTAPDTGLSARDRQIHAAWQGALSAHLARHARFPRAIRDLGKDRQATVRFSLDARGVVQSVTLVESAGSEVLDAEALALVRRASPMPVPPSVVSSEALDLIVPIRFRAQR